ncbi:MAG: hypothetical protein WBE26_19220, partial [Phycisphaerae bacterium]
VTTAARTRKGVHREPQASACADDCPNEPQASACADMRVTAVGGWYAQAVGAGTFTVTGNLMAAPRLKIT